MDERRRATDNGIALSWFGATLMIKSVRWLVAVAVIVVFLTPSALLFLLLTRGVQAEVDLTPLEERRAREHAEIQVQITTLAEELAVQNYLLSLPEDERPRLKPPAGLWERLPDRRLR